MKLRLATASWKFTGVCVNNDQRIVDKPDEPIVGEIHF